jgi:hypothetical protein
VQGFSILHQLALGFLCLKPATALGVRAEVAPPEDASTVAS